MALREPPNLVTDGREGCLITPGDVVGLTATLGRLATDDDWRRALRAGAAGAARPPADVGRRRRRLLRRPQASGSTPRLNQSHHRSPGLDVDAGHAGILDVHPPGDVVGHVECPREGGLDRAHVGDHDDRSAGGGLGRRPRMRRATRVPRCRSDSPPGGAKDASARQRCPRVVRHGRRRPPVELAVVELDPPLVDLDGLSERLGGDPRPLQRTRDHEGRPWQLGGESARAWSRPASVSGGSAWPSSTPCTFSAVWP